MCPYTRVAYQEPFKINNKYIAFKRKEIHTISCENDLDLDKSLRGQTCKLILAYRSYTNKNMHLGKLKTTTSVLLDSYEACNTINAL